MKILSFRPSTKELVGGHRPYNIDKSLLAAGVELRVVEDLMPRRLRPSLIRAMAPEQKSKLKAIAEFSASKGEKYFMVHGTYHRGVTKYLAKFGIPIIYDFRDDPIWQYDAIGLPLDKNARRKAKMNIDALMEASEHILFTSESFLEHYHTSITEKAIVVPNAGDPDHFGAAPLPDNQWILSMGTPIPCYMHDVLIDACTKIKSEFKDLELFMLDLPPILRDKPHLVDFTEKVKTRANEWISFFERRPYAEIPKYYTRFYMAALFERKNIYADTHIPLKLFDFMAAGRPMIVTDVDETARIVRQENCGLVADHSVESITENIAKLLSDRAMAQKMGENGRRAVEERHSWKHRAETIIKALE